MSRFVFALAAIAPLAVQAAVPLYGQCGGLNYTGETECVAGAVCIYQNDWYYQCVAGSATTTPASTSSTPTTSSSSTTSTPTTSSSSTSSTSTKTSSSSTKTSSTSTKTSSTSTKISSTSTRTSTTSSGGSPPPTGITSVLPASAGYTKLASASTISGSFDGGMRKYDRAGSSGDCQDQTETDEAAAVFILLPGATISNVIIGKAQAEGIHCRGTCTLRNIFWEDVCEDAATFKQTGSGDVSYVIGGGAWSGSDKIFQHNGAGTVSISNFYASSFGKLYRACGNCSTSYQRHVILNNIKMHGGSEGVGINTNWGDTAKISNVCTNGKPSATNVCCRYKGVAKGSEPSKIGCGADSSCQISGSIGSC